MIGSVTFQLCAFLAKSTAQSYLVVKKPIVADIDGMPEPKVKVVWNQRINRQAMAGNVPMPSPTQRKIPPRWLHPEASSAATRPVGRKNSNPPRRNSVTEDRP